MSPSNFPPLSCSARLSASTRRVRGSSPAVISGGRSTISPTPTMTGMRCSDCGAVVIFSCFRFYLFVSVVIPGRCEASNPESRDSGSGATHHPGMTSELFAHQRVHVLHRFDKILLAFLHHAAG